MRILLVIFPCFLKRHQKLNRAKIVCFGDNKCRRLLKSNNTLGCNILLSHQEAKHILGAVNAFISFVQFANK